MATGAHAEVKGFAEIRYFALIATIFETGMMLCCKFRFHFVNKTNCARYTFVNFWKWQLVNSQNRNIILNFDI